MNTEKVKQLLVPMLFIMLALVALSCSEGKGQGRAEGYNAIAYDYHYHDLDSTLKYSIKAIQASDVNSDTYAEALNNLAFYYIAKMKYGKAQEVLQKVVDGTDNQIELLISRVQQMRLCQRKSDNKNFYHQRHYALACFSRIAEEKNSLSEHEKERLAYAQSEYWIVLSTYYYYIGQMSKSSEALLHLSANSLFTNDKGQLLAFLYNIGSGGIIQEKSHNKRLQMEFDYLMHCYLLSRQNKYIYWEANALQAISEKLQNKKQFEFLLANDRKELDFLNSDNMPDSLLAGNLAEKALSLFQVYGDVYQIAGSWRTLSEAFTEKGDYRSALICLNNSIQNDTLINAAPDLVASIREQMSIVYSALDDKQQSDFNRNIYLDMQEYTRQDRQLEARAEQLSDSLARLDVMIVVVIVSLIGVVGLMIALVVKRRGENKHGVLDRLRRPIQEWIEISKSKAKEREEALFAIQEETELLQHQYNKCQRSNIDERAKVKFASSIVPLINRMSHEIGLLLQGKSLFENKKDSYEYIYQLASSIEGDNSLLTEWITLGKGDIMLHIESFKLGELFDAIRGSDVEYQMKGLHLVVTDTDAVVKADKVLTMFMINTICENAKRYTAKGGTIHLSAAIEDSYVEISIKDNGCGMTKEQTDNIFKRQTINDTNKDVLSEGGHGFGLINCKGIIEKYRKMSSFFSVCMIGVESSFGKGSRFFFRLPKGIKRTLTLLIFIVMGDLCSFAGKITPDNWQYRANEYVDSLYSCNVNGDYQRAVEFSDSCIKMLNIGYGSYIKSGSGMLLNGLYPEDAMELQLKKKGVIADYSLILALRNETAVAALALHKMDLYNYNNQVYTRLFRECSTDNTLPMYIKMMQKAESNRNIAIGILVSLFIAIVPVYYFFYYRHRMYYKLCVGSIEEANRLLFADGLTTKEKMRRIENVWQKNKQRFPHLEASNEKIKELSSVFDAIKAALMDDISQDSTFEQDMASRQEQAKRIRIERDRLYVMNNILENCLSSLKHETMFYPSRLKQIIDNGTRRDENEMLKALAEVVAYYKTLYSALLYQAFAATRGSMVFSPKIAFAYFNDILTTWNLGSTPRCCEHDADGEYMKIDFTLSEAAYGKILASTNLYTTDFLICSQIMRDIGEVYGARGCGICKKINKEKETFTIEISIRRDIWKNLKS